MAEQSGIFPSVNGDRRYFTSFFAEYFADFISNGIYPNPSTQCQVLANNDMTVTLKPGNAYINGYRYKNDSDLILSIDNADGVLKRIDRIVLRHTVLNREIKAYVKKGTFASSPVAPALQRDADVWELGAADVYVANGAVSIFQGNITDLRLNNTYCGIVHGVIDKVDGETLFIQFQDLFNTWLDTLKNVLDGDTAGNLLNLINNNTSDITVHTTAIGNIQSDYIRQSGYGITAGTANTYALTLSPNPTLTDGLCITVKINVTNTGASTLNVNGLGAKPITNSYGTAMTSGDLVSGNAYTLRYNGTSYVIQGAGVTATEKTAWNGKIDKSVLTAAGDIIYATGAATPAKLAKGTTGQILSVGESAPVWIDNVWSKISDTTLTAESSLINLTVPTGYKHLKLIMVVASTASSGYYDANINFNDDSTAGNYKWLCEFRYNRTTIGAENDSSASIANKMPIMLGVTPGYSVPFASYEVDISNILGKYKDVKSIGGSPAYASLSQLVGAWKNNTNEISKITIGISGYAYITGSRFLLLGMR